MFIKFHFSDLSSYFLKKLPLKEIHFQIIRAKGQGTDVIEAYQTQLHQFLKNGDFDKSLQMNHFIIQMKEKQQQWLPLDLAVDYIQQAQLFELNNQHQLILQAYQKAQGLFQSQLSTPQPEESIKIDLSNRFAELLDRMAQYHRQDSNLQQSIEYQKQAIDHTNQLQQRLLYKFKLANDYFLLNDIQQTQLIISEFKNSTEKNDQASQWTQLQISYNLLEIKCKLALNGDIQLLLSETYKLDQNMHVTFPNLWVKLKEYEIAQYQIQQKFNQSFLTWIILLSIYETQVLPKDDQYRQNCYKFICQVAKFPNVVLSVSFFQVKQLEIGIYEKTLNYIGELESIMKNEVVKNYLEFCKGAVYSFLGEKDKSRNILKKAIEDCEKLKNHEDYIDQYYYVQSQNGESLENIEMAIRYRDRGQTDDMGAEAKVYLTQFLGDSVILKERLSKSYRHPDLDKKLTNERILSEVKIMVKARKQGVNVPYILDVDLAKKTILMMFVEGQKLKDGLKGADEKLMRRYLEQVGESVGRLHNGSVIHGDLTTSNMMVNEEGTLFLIDFGLSYIKSNVEDFAVDLYVLEKAFVSTHPDLEGQFHIVLEKYQKECKVGEQTIKQLDVVRMRGRKKLAFG